MAPRPRILLALALLAAAAAPLAALLLRGRTAPSEHALWLTLATQLSWSGLAGLVGLQLGGPLRDRLGLVRSAIGVLPIALLVMGTILLSGALGFAVDALALKPGSSLERIDAIARAEAPSRGWLVLLAFGIAPAFGEELLFRGTLQRGLARRLGAPSILVAAIAFGALHMDPVHTPAAFVLGCYLGTTAFLSGSTWPAIACHLVNNVLATLPQLLPGAANGLPHPRSWLEASIWLAAAGLCAARAAKPKIGFAGRQDAPSG